MHNGEREPHLSFKSLFMKSAHNSELLSCPSTMNVQVRFCQRLNYLKCSILNISTKQEEHFFSELTHIVLQHSLYPSENAKRVLSYKVRCSLLSYSLSFTAHFLILMATHAHLTTATLMIWLSIYSDTFD